MADIKALAEELVNLSVKDVQELAQILKDEYGIEPAAAAVAVAGPAAGAGEAAAAEQTEFNVILKSAGQAKLNVVKAVKDITGLGLKEAKELVKNSKQRIAAAKKKAADEGKGGKKVLYLVQTGPMITVGKKSFITDIIEKSGNYSVTAGLNSFYPVILEEYAIKLKPDVVVLGAYTDENEARRYFPKTKIVKMTTDENDIINRPGPRVYKSVEFFSRI